MESSDIKSGGFKGAQLKIEKILLLHKTSVKSFPNNPFLKLRQKELLLLKKLKIFFVMLVKLGNFYEDFLRLDEKTKSIEVRMSFSFSLDALMLCLHHEKTQKSIQ